MLALIREGCNGGVRQSRRDGGRLWLLLPLLTLKRPLRDEAGRLRPTFLAGLEVTDIHPSVATP